MKLGIKKWNKFRSQRRKNSPRKGTKLSKAFHAEGKNSPLDFLLIIKKKGRVLKRHKEEGRPRLS